MRGAYGGASDPSPQRLDASFRTVVAAGRARAGRRPSPSRFVDRIYQMRDAARFDLLFNGEAKGIHSMRRVPSRNSLSCATYSFPTMLRRLDEGKPVYRFGPRIDELRAEGPPPYWRLHRVDHAAESGTPVRPVRSGVKESALQRETRSSDSHPVRRTFAQWQVKYGLTPSELDVLDFLSQGMTPAVIAKERSTSLGTVRTQLKSIFDKTGLRSQQAILAALLKGSDHGK